MSRRAGAARTPLYLLILGMLAAAATFLAISLSPYPDLKTHLAAFSVGGNATSFTPTMYGILVASLRALSAALGLLVLLLYFFRRRVCAYAAALMGSFVVLFSWLWATLVQTIAEESKVHRRAFAAVLVVACAIRVSFLSQPMRYDEAITFTSYASTPFYIALSNYSAPNNQLLHTLLVRVAYLLLGNEPWVLRLPALIAGILLVPASYLVGRVFFSSRSALLAAGLVAASSSLVEYSTNARGYTLVTLFFLLTLALGGHLLRRPSPAAWTLFSMLSALGFYTIPTMLYPFGSVALWLLLSILVERSALERPGMLKALLMSTALTVVLTLVLYCPVLALHGPGMIVGNEYVTSKSWEYVLGALPLSAWSTWTQWNVSIPLPIEALMVVGFAASLLFHRRASKYRVPLALPVAVWIIPVVLAQRVVPYERVWLFLLPLYLILVAAGLAYLWGALMASTAGRRSFLFALLAVGLSAGLAYNVAHTQSVYWSEETGTLRDAEAITLWLKNRLQPEDMVLAQLPSYAILDYYFQKYHLPGADCWYWSQRASGNANAARRTWVVVKEPDQTLEGVLTEMGQLRFAYSSPVLVQHYQGASLYIMMPNDSKE